MLQYADDWHVLKENDLSEEYISVGPGLLICLDFQFFTPLVHHQLKRIIWTFTKVVNGKSSDLTVWAGHLQIIKAGNMDDGHQCPMFVDDIEFMQPQNVLSPHLDKPRKF